MASSVWSKFRQGWGTLGRKIVAPKFNLWTILPVFEAGSNFSDLKMQYLKLQYPLSNIECKTAIVQQICHRLVAERVVDTHEVEKYFNGTSNDDLRSLVWMFTKKEPEEIRNFLEILQSIEGCPKTSSRFQTVINEIVPKNHVCIKVISQVEEAGSLGLSPESSTELGDNPEGMGDKTAALTNIGNTGTHQMVQFPREDVEKFYKEPLLEASSDMYKNIGRNLKSRFRVTWKELGVLVAVGVGVLGVGSVLYTFFTEIRIPSKIINTVMAPITSTDKPNIGTTSGDITIIETIVNDTFHKYNFL